MWANRKILIIGMAIIIIIGIGAGYLIYLKKTKKEVTREEATTPEVGVKDLINLNFIESPLEELKIPEMDLKIPLDFGNFNLQIPDLSTNAFIDIQTPEPKVDVSGVSEIIDIEKMIETGAVPPSNWEPDGAVCSKFKTVPSCSFVPEQYRDLCQKCKAKGY